MLESGVRQKNMAILEAHRGIIIAVTFAMVKMARNEHLICMGTILELTGVDNCAEIEDPSY